MNKNKIISLLLFVTCILTFTTSCSTLQSFVSVFENHSFIEESSTFSEQSEVENTSDEESKEVSMPDEDPVVEDTVINFLACPDNIIHPSVFYDAIERAAKANGVNPDYSDLHNAAYDFGQIYEYVGEAMLQADITYINQETLIGGTSGRIIGYPCFNSPTAVAETVIDLGVDVVNVAHNHMLDSGDTRYLENCNDVFESAGVEVIGYYPDDQSTNNITIIERKGIKVAFLSYTYGTNGIKLPSNSSFVIPTFEEKLIKKQVALAKQIADVTIVSCHWGYEDTYYANSEQKKYAALFCELGVDVVLGMHPHVIQSMEWMTSESGNKTLVIYSLGNFVSGMVAGKNMLAGMFALDIRKDAETGAVSIESPLFIPIVTHYIKGVSVAANDTGYRDFKIYYLANYTEELAATHGVCKYERSHGTTLVGGAFSKTNLINTLNKYIPNEFLPEEFQITESEAQ